MGWSTKPTDFIVTVERDLRDRRNEIAAEALQMIISSSPVDQGAFKANHRVTIDGVTLGYSEDASDSSGQQTLEAGLAIIADADKPFQEVVIQNNLPYAETLENGNSMQAPQGVYGPAFATIVAKYGGSQ